MLKVFPLCANGVSFTSKTKTSRPRRVPSNRFCYSMQTGVCAGKKCRKAAMSDFEKQMLITEIRRFVEREVLPIAHDLEHDDSYPIELIDKLKHLGVFSATIPEAYGGLGLNFATYVQIVEELARGWMSLAGIVNTHLLV